ncbi:MAG: hypothetical protein KGL39_26700 [Patescibacteria group bacterium]|nr:hypothetical protein [Patescibacteria group bacterium]
MNPIGGEALPTGFKGFLDNEDFIKAVAERISKADTIDQSLGLLWYDLRPQVQLLYPFKELIPRISRLPRVTADGGNAYHWLRITEINLNNTSIGVSEGNRGAMLAINVQPQTANYKTIGLESAVSFEARLGAKNLNPDALGIAVQSTLRSVMIGEEQTLILGNSTNGLGTTPTPTLSAAGSGGTWGAGTAYVMCVALTGLGWLGSSVANGVLGQVTKTNTDGSTDTFGGGSAQPSAEASVATTSGQLVTATVTPVAGAVAYAWYCSASTGTEALRAITTTNSVKLAGPGTGQAVTALKVSGSYVDNSKNALLPDGIIPQIYGQIFGAAPGTSMATNQNLPAVANTGDTIALAAGSGSIVYTKAAGNTGLSIQGNTSVGEWDCILQAAYDQYKLGFDRILMSSQDISAMSGFLGTANNPLRILFDAEAETGRIVAGRRVTSYLNKWFGNTLDIEVHPFVPPGTQIFWSDRVPYELSGVPNILEAHVRMDYYQIQWPFRSRRYEYGCYADEVFACYFTPAFAILANNYPAAGTPTV